jgi:Zn-dependent protease
MPELRLVVYQDTNEGFDYRKYSSQANETDYAHPDYYQPPTAHTAQPVQSLDPDIEYSEYTDKSVPYYAAEQMQEYRGPQGMEGYVADPGAEQREAAEEANKAEGKGRKKGLAGIGGIIAAIGAFLMKFPTIVLLLKFGLAGASAFVSVIAYSLLFGWPFAIGLVAQLFIHEMGHAVVMKLKGIPIKGMVFIPLFGAAVIMRQMPRNALDEAEVGIAGPIAGALAASACLFLAQQPGALAVWAPLAYFGFFINLFNLVPIVPFDGGRVLAAIDRRIWILGFLALLAFGIWEWVHGQFSPWLLLFIVLAATQFLSRNKASATPEGRSYYNVPMVARITLGVLYFGLAAVLILGMTTAHGLMAGM